MSHGKKIKIVKLKTEFIFLIFLAIVVSPYWLEAQYQGKIEGKVLDQLGNPIEKAEVIIVAQTSSSINYRLLTDKSGHFIQIGLRPGFYVVEVRKSGFLSRSFEVKVSIAEVTKVEIKLEKAQEVIERNLSEADRYFLQGNKFYADQKYAEAISSFQEAIKINPRQWAYYFNLGLTFKKIHQNEAAVQAFRQAHELNPESFSVNKELGEALARLGNFAEAKSYYEKALILNEEDVDTIYNLGICLVNLGESEKALTYFEKAISLNKEYVDAYYQLGTIYIGLNRVAEAINCLETFLKLASTNDPRIDTARQLLTYLKKNN
ncbi:MAG: tetratricopeptide repeat protein [Candidatus Aminicenantes bacterium]|nr:tetratricopeptide repeat protein [Candidatus Aminicenantes bacterium]